MSTIDEMIDGLKRLGHAADDVAREAAPLVQEALRSSASAGVDPDTGTAWTPKVDGSRPMVNAASRITSAAVGKLVVTKLTGPEVFHQNSKSKPRRVIPDGGAGVPYSVAAAVLVAATRVFDRATGGR